MYNFDVGSVANEEQNYLSLVSLTGDGQSASSDLMRLNRKLCVGHTEANLVWKLSTLVAPSCTVAI